MRKSSWSLIHFVSLISTKGFTIKGKDIWNPEPNQFHQRAIIRVSHPISNALLFYATNDTCIQQQCGLDILLLEYIALKLNKEIRSVNVI